MRSAKSKLIIDIGTENIKIIETEDRHGIPCVTKHATVKTPDGAYDEGLINSIDSMAELIGQLLKLKGFSSKTVIATISSQQILSREVVLPKVGLKDLTLLVDMEAPNHFPVDITRYSVDFKILGEVLENDTEQYNVLILLTPTAILYSYVELFEKCGLFLSKIDYKGNAISKLLKHCEESNVFERPSINVVLDIGGETSNATICKGGIIKYSRTLPFGSNHYNRELIEILGCNSDEAEKIKIITGVVTDENEDDILQQAAKQAWVKSSVPLFDEVTRVMDFFTSRQTNNAIDKMLLTGGGALIPNLVNYIHNSFDMEIGFLSCGGAVEFSDPKTDIDNFSSFFANCAGAAFDE